jgi:hypothetical protein
MDFPGFLLMVHSLMDTSRPPPTGALQAFPPKHVCLIFSAHTTRFFHKNHEYIVFVALSLSRKRDIEG